VFSVYIYFFFFSVLFILFIFIHPANETNRDTCKRTHWTVIYIPYSSTFKHFKMYEKRVGYLLYIFCIVSVIYIFSLYMYVINVIILLIFSAGASWCSLWLRSLCCRRCVQRHVTAWNSQRCCSIEDVPQWNICEPKTGQHDHLDGGRSSLFQPSSSLVFNISLHCDSSVVVSSARSLQHFI